MSEKSPLITFALFTYNQEKYVREALVAALAQEYQPLEVIVSDDCSSDNTFAIIEEVAAAYEGPHEVIVRKNEENIGVASHVNLLVELANGVFFVAAAGDDISSPNRVTVAMRHFSDGQIYSFLETGYDSITSSGLKRDKSLSAENIRPIEGAVALSDILAGRKGFVGAARTYNMAALRAFPPLNSECPTEDSVFLLRCLMYANGYYCSEKTVARRTHDNNLSSQGSLRKMNLTEIWRQYSDDAEYAYSEGYIDESEFVGVTRWIELTAFRREVAYMSSLRVARSVVGLLVGLPKPGGGGGYQKDKCVVLSREVFRRLRARIGLKRLG